MSPRRWNVRAHGTEGVTSMQAQATCVVITRDVSNETVNGVRRKGRAFITGPHFGRGVYSTTTDPAQASRFSRAEAERLLALGKWWGNDPRVEAAP